MNYIRCPSGRKGRLVLFEQKPAAYSGSGWEELAQAIILQAAEDYRAALKELQEEPGSRILLKRKKECERFFHSEWFTVLTKADPGRILAGIRKEMDE